MAHDYGHKTYFNMLKQECDQGLRIDSYATRISDQAEHYNNAFWTSYNAVSIVLKSKGFTDDDIHQEVRHFMESLREQARQQASIYSISEEEIPERIMAVFEPRQAGEQHLYHDLVRLLVENIGKTFNGEKIDQEKGRLLLIAINTRLVESNYTELPLDVMDDMLIANAKREARAIFSGEQRPYSNFTEPATIVELDPKVAAPLDPLPPAPVDNALEIVETQPGVDPAQWTSKRELRATKVINVTPGTPPEKWASRTIPPEGGDKSIV
ncbi:MAG: hypothetical protein SFT92_01820 [Rickettsiales bacterium]|nr:hypothetical protein [Rickettsiales bacterium]